MEKIIEKIQKLLRLSESSNQHEAERAATKAQELMLKHNIEMRQVENHDSEYVNKTTDKFKREPQGMKYVNAILTKYFFVQIVRSKRHDGNYDNIVGEKGNVDTALYVRDFLKNTFKKLWDEYRKETGAGARSRESFYYGIYNGLVDKLEAQKQETEAKYDLVLVDDPKAEEKVRELFGKLRSGGRRRVNNRDSQAFGAGKAQGQSLNIAAGALN